MLAMLLSNFAICVGAFFLLWIVSVFIKDASIVDIFWGPSLALPAIATWLLYDVSDPRATLLVALVSLWALRLGLYLAVRNLGHGEDFRYQLMREKAGGDRAFAIKSLYSVYLMQCVISFFVSLPVQVGQISASDVLGTGSGELGMFAMVGIVVFFIGLGFETIGDMQLRKFKKDPANKGKLMDQGLWAWTRHPNYFGDACVWTGLSLIALESSHGIFTILSPALMIFFLYAVSGKALLERLMARKYPEFDDYKARVSGFFPRPPKKI